MTVFMVNHWLGKKLIQLFVGVHLLQQLAGG
jgi:hypothetical protein